MFGTILFTRNELLHNLISISLKMKFFEVKKEMNSLVPRESVEKIEKKKIN